MRTHYQLGQGWLIDRTNNLGYAAGLLCFGFAHMAAQAMLANDMDTFNQRLERIHTIPLAAFKNPSQSKTFSEVIATFQKEFKKVNGEDKNIDPLLESIPAFLEGMLLHHNAAPYRHLFPAESIIRTQQVDSIFPVVQSQYIDMANGMQEVGRFSGFYIKNESENQLEIYFRCLRENLEKLGSEIGHPIPLVLGDSRHAITVGYDIQKKIWLLCDVSDAFTKELKNDVDIANAVMAAFDGLYSEKDKYNLIFATKIYTTKKEYKLFEKFFNTLKEDADWQELHSVTRAKANCLDSAGHSWLAAAAKNNELQIVKEILHAGNDLTQNKINDALYVAITFGHLNVIQALQENGANLENLFSWRKNLLTELTRRGDYEILQKLLWGESAAWEGREEKHRENIKREVAKSTPDIAVVLWTLYLTNPKLVTAENSLSMMKYDANSAESLSIISYALFQADFQLMTEENFKLLLKIPKSSLSFFRDIICTILNFNSKLITDENLKILAKKSASINYEFNNVLSIIIEKSPLLLTDLTLKLLAENSNLVTYQFYMKLRDLLEINAGAITHDTLQSLIDQSKQGTLKVDVDFMQAERLPVKATYKQDQKSNQSVVTPVNHSEKPTSDWRLFKFFRSWCGHDVVDKSDSDYPSKLKRK